MSNLYDLPDAVTDSLAAARPAAVPGKPTAAVEFHRVSKRFDGAPGAAAVLEQIDLSIAPGKIFGIIGRSGAGKSTLLRLINQLERPSSGQIRVLGSAVGNLAERELVRLRSRIGMVFQHFNLLAAKTVAQNVALPLQIAGTPRHEIARKIDPLLELVGLSAKRDAYPDQLSGGQKQRVGIARALAQDPALLLSDEATSALDPETTRLILALLRDINRRLGLTIVLITHQMSVIREICDSVAVLEQGRIVETGPTWRVFGDPQHDATRTLLRTLEHDVSVELAADLRSQTANPADARAMLLDVRFTGVDGREPDIGALAAVLGGNATLVHGGIDRIQGHAHGRLILSVGCRAGSDESAMLVAKARCFADHVEVLGYV